MVAVPGKIVKGLGIATETIALQMPEFLKCCPDLAKCRVATINVQLECQLRVLRPNFLVGPFVWSERFPIESFGLHGIKFEAAGSIHEAWLYLPLGSHHRLNPYYAEVLAPPLELSGVSKCKLHFDAQELVV